MELFSEHVSDRYHLAQLSEGLTRRDKDGDPIDYRLSRTTGPRRRRTEPGKRMRDMRRLNEERTTLEQQQQQPRQDPGGGSHRKTDD